VLGAEIDSQVGAGERRASDVGDSIEPSVLEVEIALGEVRPPVKVDVLSPRRQGNQFGIDGAEALVGPTLLGIPF
jgi:hypothetical protein